MNVHDDRAAARAQRDRARRALADAEAAVDRLNRARARADELLRRRLGEPGAGGGAAEPPTTSEGRLRHRMRQIEGRMQETDSRMRQAAEAEAEADERPTTTAGTTADAVDDAPPPRTKGRD